MLGTGFYPGTLLVDGGQVAADTTGVKEVTVSVPVANQQLWLIVGVQSAATTVPTLRTISGPPALNIPLSASSGSVATVAVGFVRSGMGRLWVGLGS